MQHSNIFQPPPLEMYAPICNFVASMKNRLTFPNISSLLAILCAIHCALMPILVSITPVFASWLGGAHWMEWVLVGSALLMGSVPLVRGYLTHGELRPALLLITGFAWIVSPHILDMHAWEYIFSGIGAIFLVAAQIQNMQFTQKCSCQLSPAE